MKAEGGCQHQGRDIQRRKQGNSHHSARQCTKKHWRANISVVCWLRVLGFNIQLGHIIEFSEKPPHWWPPAIHTGPYWSAPALIAVYFLRGWVGHPLKAGQQETASCFLSRQYLSMLAHVCSSSHSGDWGVNIAWTVEFNIILNNIVRWCLVSWGG